MAYDTCNANAWRQAADYMNATGADAVLFQETRVPPGLRTAEAEQTARNSKWTASLEPCVVTAAGGLSAGVGFAVKPHTGLSLPAVALDAIAGLDGARFGLRRVGGICPGWLHVGSCYLTSAVGVTAQCNLKLLEGMAFALGQLRGPWIVGGDWNCTPADLTSTGWLQLTGGVIFAPGSPTCNGKVYDFFVVAQQFAHNVRGCRTVCDAGLHPHSPARLLLNDRAVTAWVRQPKPVEPLPAILPYGPLTLRSTNATLVHDEQSLDEYGSQVLRAIETELYELLAHQCMPGELSRAEGPALVWRQLQHQSTPEHGRGNPLVHGWATVVCWLRTAITSTSLSRRQSAKWRLLYVDPGGVSRDPPSHKELQQAVLTFRAWRDRLHWLPLDDAAILKQLYVQALGFAKATAEQASRLAARAFAQWLQDGPAAGLKRQHQMSRTAVGWIPAAIGEVEADEHGFEAGDEDSPEVAAAARQVRSLQAPLSMQQAAEAERVRWSAEWAVGDDTIQPPSWEGARDLEPPPPHLFSKNLLTH